MNAIISNWPTADLSRTASASEQGAQFGRCRVNGRPQISSAATIDLETIATRLAVSLHQATGVVRESIRDLGTAPAEALIKRFTELLDPAEWDHSDEILKVGSVRTLVRALSALDCDLGEVALTRAGHVAVSWSDKCRNLRVECLADGRVSWAYLRREGDTVEAKHQNNDKIANLRLLLEP